MWAVPLMLSMRVLAGSGPKNFILHQMKPTPELLNILKLVQSSTTRAGQVGYQSCFHGSLHYCRHSPAVPSHKSYNESVQLAALSLQHRVPRAVPDALFIPPHQNSTGHSCASLSKNVRKGHHSAQLPLLLTHICRAAWWLENDTCYICLKNGL